MILGDIMDNIQSIVTRQDRKTLAISITRDGKVVVKAPFSIPLSEIKRFVDEKQGWIDAKLRSIHNVLEVNADLISYRNFLFLGTRYKPFWADVKEPTFDTANRFLIPSALAETDVLKAIAKFFRKEAKRILSQRVKIVADTMGLSVKSVKYSNAGGRWGSCSSSGVVSLNWRTIMLPTKLIDYVIVHELAHLVHMNHADRFWELVETYIPDCGILRKDLKNHAFVLNLLR